MKKIIILLALVFTTLVVACQPKDKIFPQPVRLQGGFYLGTSPTLYTTMPIGGTSTWASITGKPTTLSGFGITDAALLSHTHSALYRPISWVPSWAEVTGKPLFHAVATSGSFNDLKDVPPFMELDAALPSLLGIKLPVLTQTQINALTPVKGLLLYNDTDGVLQIYNGTIWKVIITNL